MSLTKLTPEQEALIPIYQEKWRAIALSTSRIDRQKAADAVKSAYGAIGLPAPEILFFDSPNSALTTVPILLANRIGKPIENLLESQLNSQQWGELLSPIGRQLGQRIGRQLWKQLEFEPFRRLDIQLGCRQRGGGLSYQIQSKMHDFTWNFNCYLAIDTPIIKSHFQNQLRSQWKEKMGKKLQRRLEQKFFNNLIVPSLHIFNNAIKFDFCFSVLNCPHDRKKWAAFKGLVEECGWIFPCEKIAIVCDRPIAFSFNNPEGFSADGEPAILYADGFGIYRDRGAR